MNAGAKILDREVLLFEYPPMGCAARGIETPKTRKETAPKRVQGKKKKGGRKKEEKRRDPKKYSNPPNLGFVFFLYELL